MPCSKQNISLVRGNRPVRGWGVVRDHQILRWVLTVNDRCGRGGWGGGLRPSDFAMGTNCQLPVRKRGVGGGLRPSDFGDGY